MNKEDLAIILANKEEFLADMAELKTETRAMIEALMEAFGPEVDEAFNAFQDWVARKTHRAYESYITAGFDEERAFILAANTKVALGDAVRQLKR